eukprot:TRINITY_DN61914_c0_g1_i1.p1 TRINITY_DN61914_c0_g1~~TRINITY_DN61914_c0_g1_i1.p1  ORF type:complete len:403 (+),score=64.06 TRINITY_DN61914_c0_g1_i1:120-1328(+)
MFSSIFGGGGAPRRRGGSSDGHFENDVMNSFASPPGMSSFAGVSARGLPAVWVSIDPRSGQVCLYPPAAILRLEQARQAGGPTTVPLSGLGGFYEDAVVELDLRRTANSAQQRTSHGGRRDVLRVEVTPGAEEVVVHTIHERFWQLFEGPVQGLTVERRVSLATGEMLLSADGDGTGGADESGKGKSKGRGGRREPGAKPHEMTEEERSLRDKAITEAVKDGDARGLVGLWEWCRLVGSVDTSTVPPEMWGHYTEEQNNEIEASFRALKPSIAVSIGIRSYEIIFESPEGGKQVDHGLKKRRPVRRLLVAEARRQAVLEEASRAEVETLGEDIADMECAICCTTFKESPTVPVVKLPPCGHYFHGACVQHLADKRSPCPLCREEVNWSIALQPQRAPTGRAV